MKEENLERGAALWHRKRNVISSLKALEEYKGTPLFIEAANVFGACLVDREKLMLFLQGEISSLNLELRDLGVELPEVPTIQGAQAMTKGHNI